MKLEKLPKEQRLLKGYLVGCIIEHMHMIIRRRPLMISLKTVRLLLPNSSSQVFPYPMKELAPFFTFKKGD